MKVANFTRDLSEQLSGGPAIVASTPVTAHAAGTASMHVASAVTIADAGNYYSSGTVEGALQELGAASSDVLIYDESVLAGTATSFDFQGAGVSAAVSGGTAIVTVTAGTASASIPIFDEASLMGTATAGLNFVGSSVSGTVTSGTGIITISVIESGNGPDGKPWNFTPPVSPSSYDDEFNDTTNMSGPNNGLDAQWSLHNLGTASWLILDDDVAPGCLGFDIPIGHGQDQAIYQTAPGSPTAYLIQARATLIYNGSRDMWGPFIVDSSGNGVGVTLDSAERPYLRQLSAWVQTSTTASLESPERQYAWNQPATMFVYYPGTATTFYAGVTYSDRALWGMVYQATLTYSFTPAYIGYGRLYAATSCASKHVLDYFRVIL